MTRSHFAGNIGDARQTARSETRIDWIDSLRGLGMLLVIFAHAAPGADSLKTYIHSFHVPLFFFVSGCLFDPRRYTGYAQLAKRRLRTVVIPYGLFFLLSHSVTLVRTYIGDPQSFKPAFWYEPLTGFFYGTGPWLAAVNNIALWFLPCLFVTEAIVFFLHRLSRGSHRAFSLFLALTAVIASAESALVSARMPWSADVALTASVFYGAGFLARGFSGRVGAGFLESPLAMAVLSLPFLLAGAAVSMLNSAVLMVDNSYGNYLFFICAAFCGVFGFAFLARALGRMPVLTYLGRNTLIALVLHLRLLELSGFVVDRVTTSFTRTPIEYLVTGNLWALITTALSLMFLAPAASLINRFLPILVGRQRSG